MKTTVLGQKMEKSIRMSSPKLGMWAFLAGDGATFGVLLAGYASLRASNADWPAPRDVFDIRLAVAMTFMLLFGSFLITKGKSAHAGGEAGKTRLYLNLTGLTGLLFIGLQAYEWQHLLHQGLTLSSNPFGHSVFGASFFVITGFHGAHVIAGVVFLIALITSRKANVIAGNKAEHIGLAALYWHFVDLVWILIFTVIYVI